MAGYVAYLIIVAVPAYLLALLWPPLGLAWVALLAAASFNRYYQNKGDETERKSFLYMALPVYAFSTLMVIMWFMVGPL